MAANTTLVAPAAPSRRSTTALVTAVAGLVSAFAACQRTPPEPTAKESYIVLQKAFGEQTLEIESLKHDLRDLRSSYEAYARAKEGPANVVLKPDSLGFLTGPMEVHVQSGAVGSSAASSVVVAIPSARPVTPQKPLPHFSEVESNAKAKDRIKF